MLLFACLRKAYLHLGRRNRNVGELQDVRQHDQRERGVQLEEDQLPVEQLLVRLVVDDRIHESHDVQDLADQVAVRWQLLRLVVLQLDDRKQGDYEVVDGEEQSRVPRLHELLEEVLGVDHVQVLLHFQRDVFVSAVDHLHLVAVDGLCGAAGDVEEGLEDIDLLLLDLSVPELVDQVLDHRAFGVLARLD